MREARVYNAGRQQVWREGLGVGEHALFHVDAKTGQHRTALGKRWPSHWDRTCLVFASLEEAVAYAEAKVREVPSVACRIHGAEPGTDEPVRLVANEEALAGPTPEYLRSRRNRGFAMLAAAVLCVSVDWYFDWFYLVGVLIGVRFLMGGVVALVEVYSRHPLVERLSARSARSRAQNRDR